MGFGRLMVAALLSSGVKVHDVITERVDSGNFDNAEAVIRSDSLLLRVVRDRGQMFIDVAPGIAPDRFYQLPDIEVALGRTTIDKVLDQRAVAEFGDTLDRLRAVVPTLVDALSRDPGGTVLALGEAERRRAEAFTQRLRLPE